MIMKVALLVFLLSVLTLAEEITKAKVDIKNGTIVGNVTFTKSSEGIIISGILEGLTPGAHGFHVHESGNLGNACTLAGAHLNPENKEHGAPYSEERHVGDLGNINVTDNGVAKFNFTDKVIAFNGTHNILNRSIVIHADPDDLGFGKESDSKTTGHAGERIACGIIVEVEKGIASGVLPSLALVAALLLTTLRLD